MDRSELATGHGGMVAQLTVDSRRWPGRARLGGLGSFAVRGEQDALARWCRKAWWRAGHTRSDDALVGEEGEGERGLTVCYQALRGVSRNGEARAELGEGGIEEWRAR